MNRVVVMGSRVAANMSSAYIKKQFPQLQVTVIGRSDKTMPLVGESTVEGTTLFLHECGYATILQEKHFHKFGLTFYFKMKGSDPMDRTYSIHEEPAIPPLPAALVNRWTFDRDCAELNRSKGIEYVDGVITSVELKRGAHRVTYRTPDGKEHTVTARWLIDATGRRSMLARQLGLLQPFPYQRSSYWFRLCDFDPEILLGLNREMRGRYPWMREQIAYDPYFVTHHFMGHGNWIWLIPVATEDGRRMISIGITYRPDIYPWGTVRCVDDFMKNVGREHPVITDLVKSGQIYDKALYINYLRHTRQYYSEDGWFIVGDAGGTVDPLYSTGMFMSSIQVGQIATMIGQDLKMGLDTSYVKVFEDMFSTIFQRAQRIIAHHYEVMGDPYQSALRMHWMTTIYFYFALPFFMAGYHKDPDGARLMTRMLLDAQGPETLAFEMFDIAAKQAPLRETSDVFNYYNDTINYRLLTSRETDLPLHLSRLSLIYARIRFDALKRSGFKDARRQLPAVARDFAQGLLLKSVFRDATLKSSRGFARFLEIGSRLGGQQMPKAPTSQLPFLDEALAVDAPPVLTMPSAEL